MGKLPKMNKTRRKYLKMALFGSASFFIPFEAKISFKEALSDFGFTKLFKHPKALPIQMDPYSSKVLVSTMGEGGALLLNPSRGLIKKVYAMDVACVGGSKPKYNDLYSHNFFYQTEKNTFLKLQSIGSKYIPQDLVFNDREQSISMKYQGNDLLIEMAEGWKPTAAHLEQIIEMAEEYKRIGVFKRNICASNIILDKSQDRLLAIDFKYTVARTEKYLPQEIQHQQMLLKSIDSELPAKLTSTFSDFSSGKVDKYFTVAEQLYSYSKVSVNDEENRLKILEIIRSAV